jgi:hypothetical protein
MCWTTAQESSVLEQVIFFGTSGKLTFHGKLLLDVLEVVGILAVNHTGGSLDGHSDVSVWLLLVVIYV